MKNVIRFIGLMLVAFVGIGATKLWQGGNKAVDLDGDGYEEAVVYYSGSKILKTTVDANRDGQFESVICYSKNGYREKAVSDVNGDGQADTWVYYYFTGVPWKMAEDLNRDGKPDYWNYWRDGKIYKWEQDRNGDGRADIRTVYDIAGDKTKTLVQQSYDNDFDSVFESLSAISTARRDANLPRSIAEALLR